MSNLTTFKNMQCVLFEIFETLLTISKKNVEYFLKIWNNDLEGWKTPNELLRATSYQWAKYSVFGLKSNFVSHPSRSLWKTLNLVTKIFSATVRQVSGGFQVLITDAIKCRGSSRKCTRISSTV